MQALSLQYLSLNMQKLTSVEIKNFCVDIEVFSLLGKVGFTKVILEVTGKFLSLSV